MPIGVEIAVVFVLVGEDGRLGGPGDVEGRVVPADAAFVFADRAVVLDHEKRATYLLALTLDVDPGNADADPATAANLKWLDTTAQRLRTMPGPQPGDRLSGPSAGTAWLGMSDPGLAEVVLPRHDRELSADFRHQARARRAAARQSSGPLPASMRAQSILPGS